MSRMKRRPLGGLPKEVRKTIKNAIEDGWELSVCGSGHLKLHKKGHGNVIISGTSSDWYAIKNIKGDLRRAGIKA